MCHLVQHVTRDTGMQLWTEEATLGDAMLTCLGRLPRVQWMITTLGKRGSALVHRSHAAPDASSAVLDEKLNEMLQHVAEQQPSSGDFEGCTTSDGLQIRSALR